MLKQRLRDISFFLQSTWSLTGNLPESSAVLFRRIYEENVASPILFPPMMTSEIPQSLLGLLRARGVQLKGSSYPYWQAGAQYSLLGAFGAMIQFTDSHHGHLPEGIFPPERDVIKFIALMKVIPRPVTLRDQLSAALDITENNLVGAVAICWISTRLMARGADQRAYPGVVINATELRSWNEQVARFEAKEKSGKNDGPGDNYYFWTYVFAALVFNSGGIRASFARFSFGRGTKIMTYVRNHIARKQPNMTTHEPASSLGIKMGRMFAEM